MKPVSEQINPKFVIQARKVAQYTQLLRNILPVECYNHVEVANIRQQILMLITDSPVWTTRLRQLSPQILQYIRENSAKFTAASRSDAGGRPEIIHHIQISTRYQKKNTGENPFSTNKTGNKSENTPKISRKTAELLSQSAHTIKHQKLKSALLKIARHGNRDIKIPPDGEPPETEN